MTESQSSNPFPVISMLVKLSATILVCSLILVGLHLAFSVGALQGIGVTVGLLWVAMVLGLMIISHFAKFGPWRLTQATLVAAGPRLVVCLVAVALNIKVLKIDPLWTVIDLCVLYFGLLAVETYLVWHYVTHHNWTDENAKPADTHGPAHTEVCTS
ncbi:MAG: hypothetical protein CMJ19_08170 [Phycisphaeraceae bacterium]|nr:hypothetical protein [Phycisphaeraceae bacterium]